MPIISELHDADAEVVAELRMIQERYATAARKGAKNRSLNARRQARVWSWKADRFGQLAEQAETAFADPTIVLEV